MIINDSDKTWEIIVKDGRTIILQPNEGYEPEIGQVVKISKDSFKEYPTV